eukprot:gene1081-1172_t
MIAKNNSSANLISTRPSFSSGGAPPVRRSSSSIRMSADLLGRSLASSSSANSSCNPSPVRAVEKADGEGQTTFTIDPNEDAVFVTLNELRQIKDEKDALDSLVQESMDTVEVLKQKYDESKSTNQDMQLIIDELSERCRLYLKERDDLIEQVASLKVEVQAARKAEALANSLLKEQKRIPTDAIESSKEILRSDAEMKVAQDRCVEGLRSLTDKACDYLVDIEGEHDDLLKKFKGVVSFEKKEEFDPYKGVPKKSNKVAQSGPAFVFGSPSQRFPVTATPLDEEEEEDGRDGLDDDGVIEEEPEGYNDSDRFVMGDTSYESDLPEEEEGERVEDEECEEYE